MAAAFRDYPHDGNKLKEAIHTIPAFETTGAGPFWIARAKLLLAEGVPPSYGMTLMEGVPELIVQLQKLSKKICVISNSRPDLVIPALDALFPNGSHTFDDVLALGGTEVPIKPDTAAFDLMRTRHGITTDNSVYVGNSREDIHFANASGIPGVIFGSPFPHTGEATFVGDVAALARVVRQHTDGASLSRIALRSELIGDQAESHQIPAMQAEAVRAMVAVGIRQLWQTHLPRSIAAYESSLWSEEFPSLKQVHNFVDVFGPIIGEINTTETPNDPALTAYYTDKHLHQTPKGYALRGASYFTCVDNRLTASERVSIMEEELYAALATLHTIDRSSLSPEDFLYYLGVLDNAKQQSLSLYHTATYQERRNGIPNEPEYLANRQRLFDLAVNTTRSFYEACIGRGFTNLPTAQEAATTLGLTYTPETVVHERGLKIQELDHPLKIMLAAYSAAEMGDVDTVVGFPSGGTQMAIATALAAELLYDHEPASVNVVSIPLSQHSGATKEGAQPISDDLLSRSVELFEQSIVGMRVIIVDDNSSTGSTMSRGTSIIQQYNPASIHCAVGEIDPQRMLVRTQGLQAYEQVVSVVDLRHETFSTAAGIVPVTGRDTQLRKQVAGRILGLPSWKKGQSSQ